MLPSFVPPKEAPSENKVSSREAAAVLAFAVASAASIYGLHLASADSDFEFATSLIFWVTCFSVGGLSFTISYATRNSQPLHRYPHVHWMNGSSSDKKSGEKL